MCKSLPIEVSHLLSFKGRKTFFNHQSNIVKVRVEFQNSIHVTQLTLHAYFHQMHVSSPVKAQRNREQLRILSYSRHFVGKLYCVKNNCSIYKEGGWNFFFSSEVQSLYDEIDVLQYIDEWGKMHLSLSTAIRGEVQVCEPLHPFCGSA